MYKPTGRENIKKTVYQIELPHKTKKEKDISKEFYRYKLLNYLEEYFRLASLHPAHLSTLVYNEYEVEKQSIKYSSISEDIRYNSAKAVQRLKKFLGESYNVEINFCTTPGIFFFNQSDKWTCGYRNIQMLTAALASINDPELNKLLFFNSETSDSIHMSNIPCVYTIQGYIERAWNLGFDSDGGKEFFKGEIRGKEEWIGAVELAALYSSFGVRLCLVDFEFSEIERFEFHKSSDVKFEKTNEQNQPNFCLVQFVWEYFSGKPFQQFLPNPDPTACKREWFLQKRGLISPIYFQHQGHSRTIIGVERVFNQNSGEFKTFFIILNPAHKRHKVVRRFSTLRIASEKLNKECYQLGFVVEEVGDRCILSPQEFHNAKILRTLMSFEQ
eukprot:maker-scaffold_17-snap-gene-4.49-mRNA-1 protein AED:0.04 eAED:0.05 QI:0/0/0.5/1/0/0/2/144/385